MKTRWVPYVFDDKAWGQAVQAAMASLGTLELAQLLEVSANTITRWARGASGGVDARPSMANFIQVCNLLDRNPCEFFTTGE